MRESEIQRHRNRQARARRVLQEERTRVPARPEVSRPRKDASVPPSGKPEAQEASVRSPRSAEEIRHLLLRVLTVVLCLAGLVLLFLLGRTAGSLRSLRARTEPVTFTLRYLVPGQEDRIEQVSVGEAVQLLPPVELEGYTFLRWETPDGEPETRHSFVPDRDLTYLARYALAFPTEKHLSYLSADRDGVVDVNAPLTVRELTETLYLLLDLDRVGEGRFLDVDEKDSCFAAAATLKDLGVLEGSWLYPDDQVTRLDLLQLLGRFFPAEASPHRFPDLESGSEAWPVFCVAVDRGWIDDGEAADPARVLSRGEFAHIMNRFLGRGADSAPDTAMIGMLLDVPPSHPWYADVAEAVIPHDYRREGASEVWTESSPLPVHEPGLFFAGVRLHYIAEDGTPAVSCELDGRRYNLSGEVSSGDAALDRQLWAILEKTVDPAAMEREEMLRAVYDYILTNFRYQPGTVRAIGDEGWAVDEATRLLAEKSGTSWGFSALFYELAGFLGYKPELISGIMYGTQTEFEDAAGNRIEAPKGYILHAWVEINDRGIPYIYDPVTEVRSNGRHMMFKRYDPVRWQQGYRREPKTSLW